MRSYVQTVLALFENKRRYIVPLFQRQYAWSLDRQWKPLWEDIERKVVDRLRWNEKREHSDSEEQLELESKPPAEHFQGAIVLDMHHVFGNEVPAQTIIDGQQRLMTSQILLAALRDTAKKHGVDDYLSELKHYTANEGIMADPVVEKYKVWPSQFDQPHFELIIETGDSEQIAAHYAALKKGGEDGLPLLIRAYLFFSEKLDELMTAETVSERLLTQPNTYERLKALFEVFQHDLQIVSIWLDLRDAERPGRTALAVGPASELSLLAGDPGQGECRESVRGLLEAVRF